MRYLILVLLLLGAQFSLTAFAPAEGKAWLLWPFANNSKPILGFFGGLPKRGAASRLPCSPERPVCASLPRRSVSFGRASRPDGGHLWLV